MKPKRTETDLVRACLDYLSVRGIFAWRVNSGAIKIDKRFIRMQSINGVSDILGVLSPTGRLLAVECKVGKNKTTPDQDRFLQGVRDAGGLAVVAYTVDDVHDAINNSGAAAESE